MAIKKRSDTKKLFFLPLSIPLFFSVISVILVSIFLVEYHFVGQSIYGDGRYYFAFTHSLFFHHSFNISSEMAHAYSPLDNNHALSISELHPKYFPIEHVTGEFSLGLSIYWLPFIFVADMLTRLLNLFGFSFILNGYSDSYQVLLGIGNIGFIIGGLVILYKMLQKFFTEHIVQLSIITILFGTNLFYYSSIDVVNSHPFSFFLASAMMGIFIKFLEKKQIRLLFLEAFILGALVANRSQDLVFAIVPAFSLGFFLWKEKSVIQTTFVGLGMIVGTFIGYVPQLLLLFVGRGKVALAPHVLDRSVIHAFDFLHPHILGLLINNQTGLLFYSPLVFVAFVGLGMFYKREQFLGGICLLVVLLQLYVISSWFTWNQAASYGIRMLVSSYPLLAIGVAQILTWVLKRYSAIFIVLLCGLFIFHQLLMIVGFKLFIQAPTTVGTQLSRSGKFKLMLIQWLQKRFGK